MVNVDNVGAVNRFDSDGEDNDSLEVVADGDGDGDGDVVNMTKDSTSTLTLGSDLRTASRTLFFSVISDDGGAV